MGNKSLYILFISLVLVSGCIEKEISIRDILPIDIGEQEEPGFKEKVLRQHVEAAMEPSPCPVIEKQEYPDSYYKGPLTDTHLHIPAIPDFDPREDREIPPGRFGGPRALLGWNVRMSEIACTLKNEGTIKNFAFFPVYPEIPSQLLEIANRTMQQYPTSFTPFIMPPGKDDVPPTAEANALSDMLDEYPGLFRGYGEIGIYDIRERNRKAEDFPPDAQIFQEIYPVVKKHKLMVYMHPGEGHKDNFENVLKQHPDIDFIVHGDEIEGDIDDLMDKYPNIYYTCDPSYYQHFPLYVGKSREEFLAAAEKDFDSLIEKDLERWKKLIEKHPDRVMWGTDRGDAEWNYDVEVGLFLVRYARAFIGRLDHSVQENFAYKNAEQLINKSLGENSS
ncbi:amidohydrolase family protein [Candidatus Micrarchaeota archaeon]|nr:amidohydrolase family protein [Candidatus Micrarchaeota archaeon]